MKLTLNSIALREIGADGPTDELMWGTLRMDLHDELTDGHPNIDIILMLPNRPEVTLAQLNAHARQSALEILREAVRKLESE